MINKTANESPLLELENISVSRNGKLILENITLSVARNEIVTLIGPNGSGKSTLVKVALGLITPDSGSVSTSSKQQAQASMSTQPKAIRIGYVPQSIEMDQTLPINVQRFMQLHAHHKTAATLSIDAALKKAGASHLLNTSMHALSGGELRRVLLARTLIQQPDLLILDEPTAGVDINGQAALYALIQQLRDDLNCGVLLVSHDLHIVMKASNKVVCLNRHLCCSGLPADVSQNPEFVQLFGQQLANELAIYHHQHDHQHGLHGEICESPELEHNHQNDHNK